MSDKTCGNCGRLRERTREGIAFTECYYNASHASNGLLIPHSRKKDQLACEGWTKDSVEQIVLEMYGYLSDVESMGYFMGDDFKGVCDLCIGNGEDCHGDYLCEFMADFARDEFAARLRAQGIEVPEW